MFTFDITSSISISLSLTISFSIFFSLLSLKTLEQLTLLGLMLLMVFVFLLLTHPHLFKDTFESVSIGGLLSNLSDLGALWLLHEVATIGILEVVVLLADLFQIGDWLLRQEEDHF